MLYSLGNGFRPSQISRIFRSIRRKRDASRQVLKQNVGIGRETGRPE